MNRSSFSQRPRIPTASDSSSCGVYTSPPMLPHGSMKLPMLGNSSDMPPRSPSRDSHSSRMSGPEGPSANRLSIENMHLTHQNGTLARELAHSRYTIHALRQIVNQKEAAEQRVQNELKQSLWRVRVLEAVIGRMSEQLVLLMGEQRGGFEEGTDIMGLAREVAVGEFYRQHAALQQRDLEAIRGELGVRDEEEFDPEEEEEEYDDNQQSATISGDLQDLSGKNSPPPPMITVTDSDAEQPPTFDSDQSPSSSSSEDDDSEDYLEDAEERFNTPPVVLDPSGKKIFDVEPAVVVEERPGLRADVLFARMRIAA